MTGIALPDAAISFYCAYGGMFRDADLLFEGTGDPREFSFLFFTDLPGSIAERKRRLADALDDIGSIQESAGKPICPVAEIGYYYPATVFVAEDGVLFCMHEYEDEIRACSSVEEILEHELQSHVPTGVQKRGQG